MLDADSETLDRATADPGSEASVDDLLTLRLPTVAKRQPSEPVDIGLMSPILNPAGPSCREVKVHTKDTNLSEQSPRFEFATF
jgi:hypothetical protein